MDITPFEILLRGMRHRVFGKKLNRDIKERKALFKNLIIALISRGKIKTTLAKAKAIQRLAEKMVTKAKSGSSDAKRQMESFLTQKDVINKLVSEVAPRFKDISGGYTRIRRIGERLGDSTEEVMMEWSKAEEKKPEAKPMKLSETKKPESTKQVKKAKPKKTAKKVTKPKK